MISQRLAIVGGPGLMQYRELGDFTGGPTISGVGSITVAISPQWTNGVNPTSSSFVLLHFGTSYNTVVYGNSIQSQGINTPDFDQRGTFSANSMLDMVVEANVYYDIKYGVTITSLAEADVPQHDLNCINGWNIIQHNVFDNIFQANLLSIGFSDGRQTVGADANIIRNNRVTNANVFNNTNLDPQVAGFAQIDAYTARDMNVLEHNTYSGGYQGTLNGLIVFTDTSGGLLLFNNSFNFGAGNNAGSVGLNVDNTPNNVIQIPASGQFSGFAS